MDPNSPMFASLAKLRDFGFSPKGVIDVGAYQGDFSRGARMIFPDAKIVMVEALQEKAEILAQVQAEIGNAELEVTLLGESESAEVPFYVLDSEKYPNIVKTGSSKYKENSNFVWEERKIPQQRLESVIRKTRAPCHFVKLDVQGAELEVLRGLGFYLSQVEAILMEISLVDYNKGGPLIDEVLAQMRELNFVLYDIVGMHRWQGDRLFQIDGLFVRPNAPMRPQPPFH